METESIGSSIGSSIATAAPSFGGGIESSFSFADTAPLSFSPDLSAGGSFEPGFDFGIENSVPSVFETGLSDINLDPDLPAYQIPEAFRVGLADINLDPDITETNNYEVPEVFEIGLAESNLDPGISDIEIPQVFQDSFKEDLLVPELYSEAVNIIDLPYIEPQNNIIEQINYSIEPEIAQAEAKILVEDCRVLAAASPRNDSNELAVTPEPQIEIQAQDQTAINEVQKIGKVEIVENEDIPGIALPQMQQSIQTYEALINAGIKTEQAGILVEQALIRAGTEPEVAQKVATQIKTGALIKTKNQVKQEAREELEEEDEEEKKKKKIKKLKFVVDGRALTERDSAFKRAVDQAPGEIKNGMEIIDSNIAVALMPTEVERVSVKSSILSPYEIELFGIEPGDGSYREATERIRNLGKISRKDFYLKGYDIFRALPPVAIEEDGQEVKEEDVDRVRRNNPDPIRALRKIVVYN